MNNKLSTALSVVAVILAAVAAALAYQAYTATQTEVKALVERLGKVQQCLGEQLGDAGRGGQVSKG
jgi:predicted lysophospholipase L1 biosynthesis ABC-type transport system permease subunit